MAEPAPRLAPSSAAPRVIPISGVALRRPVTAMLRGRPPQNATLFRKTDHNRLIRGLICIAVR